MKAALLLVAALVAVVEVHGQPEESTTVANPQPTTVTNPQPTTVTTPKPTTESSPAEDEDAICVEADNTLYLYANVQKLYYCYDLLPKIYVVQSKDKCTTELLDCPRN
ncbi:uncharacterized protein LOC126332098 isoform X1 [Schistocerca gregaria]|uniref:uncharacterized protein LOC126332098 isoform X1 n=1 Tax=Schistocerca gregaria TaxID=7010 RepID=UPI00211DCF60|nr:uncharacterized protein LOC126332098 isoform X1 [Schistocerca gregaria]